MVGYIYCITCNITGKWYIGQTNRTIKGRWSHHVKCALKQTEDTKFHRAIRKYGVENFTIEEVMFVESPTKEGLKCKLDYLEQHFIRRYDTKRNGYNSTWGGDGVLGLKFSEESKRKMSKTWFKKGFVPWNKGVEGVLVAWNKGKAFSEETCKKMSESHKGKPSWNKGRSWTDSQKKVLSETHKGQIAWNKGKKGYMKHTEEWKHQNSIRMKEIWKLRKEKLNYGTSES